MNAARRLAGVPRCDGGSAAADFALVAGLLSLAFVGLLALGLTLHTRSVLTDCASAAARHGALAGSSPQAAAERARLLVATSLPGLDVGAVRASHEGQDGYRVVRVEIDAAVPLAGAIGIGRLTATGRALAEEGEP